MASQVSEEEIKTYQNEFTQLKIKIARKEQQFAENAKYRVTVIFGQMTKALTARALGVLTEAGFKASAVNYFRLASIPFFRQTVVGVPSVKAVAEKIRDLFAHQQLIRHLGIKLEDNPFWSSREVSASV